jgi:hypothetical protein
MPQMNSERGPHSDPHGIVASGSGLMEDAITKEAIAKEQIMMCFRTEATGLMNHIGLQDCTHEQSKNIIPNRVDQTC